MFGSKKTLLLLCTFGLIQYTSLAQLSLSYPFNGTVFQRNASGQGNIPIGGSYTGAVDRIEARAVSVAGGSTTGWATIHNNPSNGIFGGTLNNVSGGWYTLEVRSVLFNNVVQTTSLSRVGVGEVFVVAGQSNGRGLDNYGALASSDGQGRVKYINSSWPCPNGTCQSVEPPFPVISTLNSTFPGLAIAPNGVSPWAYGELGDALIGRFNVPVAFFNTAADGTSVGNWSRSSDGLPSAHVFFGTQYANNADFPYHWLRKSLNYYAHLFGIRAILWHQGESDNLKNNNGDPSDNTSAAEYRDSLQYVINKSRAHSGKSALAWAVSRASYLAPRGADSEVVNGQNSIINSLNKIFAGPETDNIQIPREDGVHIKNVSGGVQGVSQLASAWNSALNTSFFNDATPYAAATLPNISLSCSGGTYSISGPVGYQYFWVNNNDDIALAFSANQTITPGTGTYRVYLKDPVTGNITISQAIVVPSNNPQPPTVSASAANVASGQPVTLYAQGCMGTVTWSVGGTGNSIVHNPTQNTNDTASCSIGSCMSMASNTVTVSNCSANMTITATYNTGTTLNVQTSNSITGQTSNVINSGANITYDAKRTVTLLPGFTANKGSVFLAKVGTGCN